LFLLFFHKKLIVIPLKF